MLYPYKKKPTEVKMTQAQRDKIYELSGVHADKRLSKSEASAILSRLLEAKAKRAEPAHR